MPLDQRHDRQQATISAESSLPARGTWQSLLTIPDPGWSSVDVWFNGPAPWMPVMCRIVAASHVNGVVAVLDERRVEDINLARIQGNNVTGRGVLPLPPITRTFGGLLFHVAGRGWDELRVEALPLNDPNVTNLAPARLVAQLHHQTGGDRAWPMIVDPYGHHDQGWVQPLSLNPLPAVNVIQPEPPEGRRAFITHLDINTSENQRRNVILQRRNDSTLLTTFCGFYVLGDNAPLQISVSFPKPLTPDRGDTWEFILDALSAGRLVNANVSGYFE